MTDTVWFDLPDGVDSFMLTVTWTVKGINTNLGGFCNGTTAYFRLIDGYSGKGVTWEGLNYGCSGGIGAEGAVDLEFSGSFEVFDGINYSLLTWLELAGQYGWVSDFTHTAAFRLDIPAGVTMSSASGVLLTNPDALPGSFKLSSGAVAGCKSVRGVVELDSPAPAGGLVLNVSDTLVSANPPATVKVAEGATKKSFSIKTTPVAASESGTVTVSLGAASLSRPLTIRPMGLQSVTLKPTTVAGSQPVNGTAKLEFDAGPGPISVDLSSSKPSVAHPVATSVAIPQEVRSKPFTVATNAVLAKTYAMITGEANGTTKTRKLNVTPAAEVSPRSFKFGNVTVDSTSDALTTTLTNKGTSAFFVDSIGITGSCASWFSQTNNCPSSLPAGGSCTISVKFKPEFAAKKSAKLTIATSATSTPLTVSLSGIGI